MVWVDPAGLAYLIFDRTSQTIALYHDTGKVWGSWWANSGTPGTYSPITTGQYELAPANITHVSLLGSPLWYLTVQDAWGPARVPLEPTPSTDKAIRAAGRTGGFFLHGGTSVGTAGCAEMENPDLLDLLSILESIGTPVGLTVN